MFPLLVSRKGTVFLTMQGFLRRVESCELQPRPTGNACRHLYRVWFPVHGNVFAALPRASLMIPRATDHSQWCVDGGQEYSMRVYRMTETIQETQADSSGLPDSFQRPIAAICGTQQSIRQSPDMDRHHRPETPNCEFASRVPSTID